MTDPAGHAVVLGGSLAGLAAAAVLAERFQRVTIVERDTLPRARANIAEASRKGDTSTSCCPRGRAGLGELLPGVIDDLRARGACVIDATELRFHIAGGRLRLDGTGLEMIARDPTAPRGGRA